MNRPIKSDDHKEYVAVAIAILDWGTIWDAWEHSFILIASVVIHVVTLSLSMSSLYQEPNPTIRFVSKSLLILNAKFVTILSQLMMLA